MNMTSWKTTAAGVGAITTAIGIIAHMFATDMWDANQIGAAGMGIMTGLGLLFAKDHDVTGGSRPQ
jgi:hypothetical protein